MASGTMELIVTTEDVANFFEVTKKTVSEWRKAGCPRVKQGKWNLKEVFDWWWDNIGQDRAEQESSDESLNEAKRLTQWEKYRNEKMKNEQLSGELINKETVYKEWSNRMLEFKNACFNLETALPPLLEGKSQAEMRKIIYDFVWNMFDRVTRRGKFCPTPKQSKSKQTKKKTTTKKGQK